MGKLAAKQTDEVKYIFLRHAGSVTYGKQGYLTYKLRVGKREWRGNRGGVELALVIVV